MNDYVSRDEYNKLVEEVRIIKEQLAIAVSLLHSNSNLVTPEQQQTAYNEYMNQMQSEAIHEDNLRAFK